jgi:hypothetical protein
MSTETTTEGSEEEEKINGDYEDTEEDSIDTM